MSIKSAMKALFSSEKKAAPTHELEITVATISKDLVATMAKLDSRSKILDSKIAAADAAAAAAMESKRKAVAEQGEAAALSKKISELVSPSAMSSIAINSPSASIPAGGIDSWTSIDPSKHANGV
jgi:hypothetical protein